MVATPQGVRFVRDKNMVVQVVEGVGNLTIDRDTAHGWARELMRLVNEIDQDDPGGALRNAMRRR